MRHRLSKASLSINILLLLSVLILTTAGIELYVRMVYPSLEEIYPRDLIQGHFQNLYEYNQALGWIPKSNHEGTKWNVPVTTGEQGLRLNGHPYRKTEMQSQILAVGDSFIFGDEVGDAETLSAQLETSLQKNPATEHIQILNAGVSSYGLDQIVLRAEQLVPIYKPRIVILSLVPEDIERCFQSIRHGVAKPYFRLDGKTLELKNSPTPKPKSPSRMKQALLVNSAFFRYLVQYTNFRNFFLKGTMLEVVSHEPTKEETNRLLEALTQRILQLQKTYHFKLIFFFYPNLGGENLDGQSLYLLNLFKQENNPDLLILDILDIYRNLPLSTEKKGETYFNVNWDHHPNRLGHHLVADQIEPLLRHLLTFEMNQKN